MDATLLKINAFLQKHHILSLASSGGQELSVCTLFYTYLPSHKAFVFASEEKTEHIKQIRANPKVAGTIALETKIIGKIQGIQFRGECKLLEDKELAKNYYKAFPYALAMNPTLWVIEVVYFKFTDNTLGFGKKLIWQDVSP
jgi:uncharacterized protein